MFLFYLYAYVHINGQTSYLCPHIYIYIHVTYAYIILWYASTFDYVLEFYFTLKHKLLFEKFFFGREAEAKRGQMIVFNAVTIDHPVTLSGAAVTVE